MKKQIVVVGDVMMDIIVYMHQEMQRGSDAPSNISTTFGGVAANVAAWLGFQQSPCTIYSVVGDDPWGHLIIQHLQSLGVESAIAVEAAVSTGIVVALAHPDGERSMFPDSRANQLLSHQHFSATSWDDVAWLYMSGYTLLQPSTRELALHVMRTARKHDVKVALDPASSAPLSEISAKELDTWFAEVDLLLPNEQELSTLSATTDWTLGISKLAQRVPAVIAKLGARGAVISSNGNVHEIPAIAVNVVDSVGAGDAFAAGTLSALARGEDLITAATNGSKIASLALQVRGAQPASRLH